MMSVENGLTNGVQKSKLMPYTPPVWARNLAFIPKWRIKLVCNPTPIEEWDVPDLRGTKFTLHIKRDDMTGSTLSGNKVRKLEFLLADALANQCHHVITMGGIHSNHCRAVALACRQMKLVPHLFFLSDDLKCVDDIPKRGNMLLNLLCGAHLNFAPRNGPYFQGLLPAVKQTTARIRATGENVYEIPSGGSNRVGFYGYIEAFQEIMEQGLLDDFDDIVLPAGSCGTAAAIAIANYLTGSKLRVHAVLVFDGKNYAKKHVNDTLFEFGITDVTSDDIIDVVENYHGEGYGKTDIQEKELIAKTAAETGIVLDTVYTIKAFRGMLTEIKNNPGRFKGARLLFIHTGGIFGNFGGTLEDVFASVDVNETVHFY